MRAIWRKGTNSKYARIPLYKWNWKKNIASDRKAIKMSERFKMASNYSQRRKIFMFCAEFRGDREIWEWPGEA